MTARKRIVTAQASHVFRIAAEISEGDRGECEVYGITPFQAIGYSYHHSAAAWTGLVDDMPVCMFGVVPLDILSGKGSPWFLATAELKHYAVTFIKLCRPCLETMLDIFPNLLNYVDAQHVMGIRWLKWLGFQFEREPIPCGKNGALFYRFKMES